LGGTLGCGEIKLCARGLPPISLTLPDLHLHFTKVSPARECPLTFADSSNHMLPGGQTDKLGNRYETWWTVSQLIRVIAGEALTIRIEHPGFDKTEFIIETTRCVELHQAKRASQDGKWSLAALGNSQNKLLQAVGSQLAGNNREFHFVSGSDAPELRELAERTRDAESSFEEFKAEYLAAKVQRENFSRLRNSWGQMDEREAFETLKRIFVHSGDETLLVQLVTYRLRALFLARSVDIISELRAIATDRICQTITRDAVLAALAARGFSLRKISDMESSAAAIESIASSYVTGISRRLIGGSLIPRKAAEDIANRILSARQGTITALTGKAGGGKSGCTMQLVDLLRANGLPVLALRLDRYDPVTTAAELGAEAGLEESPALVLAGACDGRPGALVIDQLDAVSTTSGRNADFLEAVDCLLEEARGLSVRSPIHVVLVCRKFDWENDHRLRKLITKEDSLIELADLTVPEITAALAAAGFDAARLSSRQMELLQLPQNLALFIETVNAWENLAAFGSTKDLFTRYWNTKREAVVRRAAPEPDRWGDIVDFLADRMTSTQQLSAPRELLDSFPQGFVNQMISEGVLADDGLRISFGHESFFDYCYARRFVRNGHTLLELLATGEQHLFRRAQVRQILAYLRDSDPARYCREIDSLLRTANIRAHVKDLALSLVGAVSNVLDAEWDMLFPWIERHLSRIAGQGSNEDKLEFMVWRHFYGSRSWFMAANQRGILSLWLASESDTLVNLIVGYLQWKQRTDGDTVAALLEPYADAKGRWPERLRACMSWANHENSRRSFELLIRLIDNGVLDEEEDPRASNRSFWSRLHGLCGARPDWVPEVLAHWLRRRLVIVTLKQDDDSGQIPWSEIWGHDEFGGTYIGPSAEQYPEIFVAELLDIFLQLSDVATYKDSTAPHRDAVWDNFYPTQYVSFGQACQMGMRRALGSLAGMKSPRLVAILEDLGCRESHFSNVLTLREPFTTQTKRWISSAPSRGDFGVGIRIVLTGWLAK
jgi:hypothetical protein